MKSTILKLINNNKTISFAESCTGGALSHVLTTIPGVSSIYSGGFIAYSNEFKIKFLDINKKTIEKYGVVSKEVASEMANGLYAKTNADICISTTGNAGPSKCDIDKEVGKVFVGIRYKDNTETFELSLNGSREEIINEVVDFVYKKIDSLF